jgi:hypothetical protein
MTALDVEFLPVMRIIESHSRSFRACSRSASISSKVRSVNRFFLKKKHTLCNNNDRTHDICAASRYPMSTRWWGATVDVVSLSRCRCSSVHPVEDRRLMSSFFFFLSRQSHDDVVRIFSSTNWVSKRCLFVSFVSRGTLLMCYVSFSLRRYRRCYKRKCA